MKTEAQILKGNLDTLLLATLEDGPGTATRPKRPSAKPAEPGSTCPPVPSIRPCAAWNPLGLRQPPPGSLSADALLQVQRRRSLLAMAESSGAKASA